MNKLDLESGYHLLIGQVLFGNLVFNSIKHPQSLQVLVTFIKFSQSLQIFKRGLSKKV
jgi:hypothetical protein